jgi:hypothetical protein
VPGVRRVLVVTFVMVMAACSSGHTSKSTAAPGGSEQTTSTQPPTATARQSSTTALAGAGTAQVSVPDRTPTAVLTTVRTAHQPGFDRVVFEFSGPAPPGYTVTLKTGQPVQDASGQTVKVAGNAYLAVRLAHASEANPATGQVVYQGPTRITPADTMTITEVVATGDFEGVLSWAIGLREETPFRVSELTNPARLIVDIQAG